MKRHILPFGRIGRFFGLVVPVAALVLAGVQLRSGAQPAPGGLPPGAMPGSTTESMIAKATADKYKFHGANSCKGATCHDSGKPQGASKMAMNENTLWAGKDEHAKAYKTLKGGKKERVDRSLAIWAKYKGAGDPATPELSQKCQKCHGLLVDAPLKGQAYNITEGVTCNSCHGPYEKIRDPHSVVGWADKERAANGNDPVKFWDKWAFYDTKDNKARADKCTSCHLSIEAKMVEAGHPQPHFDLYIYSSEDVYKGRHWKQEKGLPGARLWAIGQGVSLRDALTQLAERASGGAAPATVESAAKQALAHHSVFSAVFTSKAGPGDSKNLDGWMAQVKAGLAAKDNKKMADAAKQAAGHANLLADGLKAWNPTAANAGALIQAVAGTKTTATEIGELGAEQQSNAIYALYDSIASPKETDPVLKQINDTLFPEPGKFDAAAYGKALTDIQPKLPK